jgi:nucleotide-binding universal stress UspA family protein
VSRKVLDLAAALACLEDSELHVVHPWSAFAEQVLRGSARLPAAQVDQIVEQARMTATRRVEDLLHQHGLSLPATRVHLPKGEANLVVPPLAESLDAGVLVMGTAVETGLARLLIGETAERILDATNCPVLTVRPDTYIPPAAFEASPALLERKAS